jgi:hypothetical protein
MLSWSVNTGRSGSGVEKRRLRQHICNICSGRLGVIEGGWEVNCQNPQPPCQTLPQFRRSASTATNQGAADPILIPSSPATQERVAELEQQAGTYQVGRHVEQPLAELPLGCPLSWGSLTVGADPIISPHPRAGGSSPHLVLEFNNNV